MGHFGARSIVWVFWFMNLLLSIVYLAISIVTFHNVQWGMKFLKDFPNRAAFKNSLLASCMLSFLIVLFWIIFSFFVLLGRFFAALPLGYGVILGTCCHTGFFSLLAGLVLQTHEDLAAQFKKYGHWSGADYQTYVATYAFNYILCGSYILLTLVLVFTAGAFTKKEERSSSYVAKAPSTAGATPSAASGTAANIDNNHGFGANWPNSYRGGNV
ncbi:hypothetical protein Vretimale_7957 [Volvox reticuliferus]|uniref:Uncharacterized protein n=1 Tax=Volvox reticuliferus TaxID=1737510 RepID=A0A8J4GAT4_9CHLO|nr:hypothetical protein Vretifemale_5184 [Volvox reticuliferus]GIM03259.1 hypothetical protein Vretimale_7957 [Volvox reticuliferus]